MVLDLYVDVEAGDEKSDNVLLAGRGDGPIVHPIGRVLSVVVGGLSARLLPRPGVVGGDPPVGGVALGIVALFHVAVHWSWLTRMTKRYLPLRMPQRPQPSQRKAAKARKIDRESPAC